MDAPGNPWAAAYQGILEACTDSDLFRYSGSWHHRHKQDTHGGRSAAQQVHAVAVSRRALHHGLHHGRRAHAVSWLRCCAVAPWRQATGWWRQRRRHLHPLLLCTVLACKSNIRHRELCGSRRAPGTASHVERCPQREPGSPASVLSTPRFMPSGMPAMPKTSMSKEPRPGLAKGTLQHTWSHMARRVSNTLTVFKTQGAVRGLSTHALRLILCTCDEWTCRAAAECILRLQSVQRQCFSCR